jgi:hypothetical protein
MTLQSLALFVHLMGMLALFVTLALEWTGVNPGRLRRLSGCAFVLILASGIGMAARVGVFRSAWVGVSFAAMAVMAVLGAAARREPFRRASLRARVGVALAIVFLIVAKPDLLQSLAIAAAALIIGAAAGVMPARAYSAEFRGSR